MTAGCSHERCSAQLRIERPGLTAYLICDVCALELRVLENQTREARRASCYSSHEREIEQRVDSFIRTAHEIHALPETEPAREREPVVA